VRLRQKQRDANNPDRRDEKPPHPPDDNRWRSREPSSEWWIALLDRQHKRDRRYATTTGLVSARSPANEPSMSDDLPLAAAFPAATYEQWVALASRVLKGKPIEALTSHTADGIAIAPLYLRARENGRIASRAGHWQVMARVDHPDSAAANAQALED